MKCLPLEKTSKINKRTRMLMPDSRVCSHHRNSLENRLAASFKFSRCLILCDIIKKAQLNWVRLRLFGYICWINYLHHMHLVSILPMTIWSDFEWTFHKSLHTDSTSNYNKSNLFTLSTLKGLGYTREGCWLRQVYCKQSMSFFIILSCLIWKYECVPGHCSITMS